MSCNKENGKSATQEVPVTIPVIPSSSFYLGIHKSLNKLASSRMARSVRSCSEVRYALIRRENFASPKPDWQGVCGRDPILRN